MALVPPLLEALKARDAGDIKVLVGGVIPEADRGKLQALGAAAVFDQDTGTDEIVAWIRRELGGPETLSGATPQEASGGAR